MKNGDLVLVTHYFEDRKMEREFVTVLRSDPDPFGFVLVKDPFTPGDLAVAVDKVQELSQDEAAEILGW